MPAAAIRTGSTRLVELALLHRADDLLCPKSLMVLIVCRLNPVSEDGTGEEDDKNTMRLVEGISHPSRAEDVQDLHRLQKSSTKPRQGAQSALCAQYTPFVPDLVVLRCEVLLQMTLVKLPLFPRLLDQAPERKLSFSQNAY